VGVEFDQTTSWGHQVEIALINMARLRLVVFLALVTFMVGEPLYHYKNGLGGFRDWKMFQGAGWGVIDARFTRVLDDGSEAPLDRLKLLEDTYKAEPLTQRARNNVWLIRKQGGGEVDIANRLCVVLPPNTKLKIYSRISKPGVGWRQRFDGKIIECNEE
jgi:hypothetical protein